MGSSARYGCDECGFDSGDLKVGCGFDMIDHQPLACPTCRKIRTRISPVPSDAPPFWEKEARADEIEVEPCPSCRATAELLWTGNPQFDRPRQCPQCGERTLTLRDPENFVLWD